MAVLRSGPRLHLSTGSAPSPLRLSFRCSFGSRRPGPAVATVSWLGLLVLVPRWRYWSVFGVPFINSSQAG